MNRVTGEACSYKGNFLESDCVFKDNEDVRPESGYASMMYKSFVDTVSTQNKGTFTLVQIHGDSLNFFN